MTGLLDGENYQIDVSDNHKLKITFYKDTEKTQTGLQPSTQERDIVITLTTKVNQDWLNDAEAGLQAKAHVNNIKFTGGGNVVTASASAMPVRFTIEKKATDKEPVSYTAEGLPVYRFDVIMTGVTGALELQDTFDTRYFKLYNNNSWDSGHLFYGQDQWYQGNDCGKVMISSHNTGIKIICPSKIIQKDSNGNYYPYYKISYYLQVKDTNALKELKQQAAINGGTIGLTNTIESNGKTSSTSFNYKYDGLSKELLNESSIGGDNTLAKYKITINPDEIKMNQGQKFNVVDEFENLRIDYTSITVRDKEGHDLVASQEVTYNFKGNKGTFTIPDKKTIIIQYDAYVIGTGYVTFKNKISYANYADEKSCSKDMNSQGTGSASLLSITILKCEEGMTSNKLKGAEFQLFRASNDERLGDSTYKTDENGTVTIAPGLNEDRFVLYSGTQYYLKEVKAPEGYQCSDTKYYFEIDENNQVDYDNYVYANNDIIKISNKKISIAGTQQSAKFTLKANKTLSKGQLNGLDYTFELKNKYDNSQTSIASNDGQGNIEFESIEFNEAKDYAFELYEKVPQDLDSPIIYDTTKYEILIRVEVDTDNNLKVTNVVVKKGDSVVYTSTPSIKWASYELDLTSLDKPTFRNVVKVSTKITKVNTMNEKLSNATFVVKDKEGNTVKTWQSSKDSDYEIIDNLVPDEEYTLSETQAPEGYDIASPITFIVKENGDVYIGSQKIENNMIVMTDTLKKYTVDISKVDEQGLALKGVELKITGKNIENQEITPIEFTSTESLASCGLEPGTYTLTEVEAPDGYELSDSIQFSISNDGKVIINNQEQSDRTITMIDRKTSITVGKYDIETKEPLSGCVIQILDENKDVVSEVNTTIDNSEIEITGLKVETQYYFKEHIAPQGYAVNKYLIPFVLRKDGTLKIATINSDKEIEEVDDYKEFFEDGILKSKDNITSVKISKVDIVNENELSGAIIQIIDSNGQIVKEWTSTHQPEEITGLKTGEVYTLKEIVAPRGYSVTTDTKFVLKEDGTIDHTKTTTSINEEGILLIEDSMLFVEISKVVATT